MAEDWRGAFRRPTVREIVLSLLRGREKKLLILAERQRRRRLVRKPRRYIPVQPHG